MKREKARLAQLRSMPYEDYLQTPEWQEVQKAALQRAGNQCQGCKAENVTLSAYHTSYDHLGCEQEDDAIVLCEACYERLSHYGKLAQSDDAPEEPGEEQMYPHFPLSKRALIFGPSALVTMGLPALLHAPLPAELFGLGAAIALAANSPKLYAEMRGSLPTPLVALLDGRAERKRAEVGEWNTWDRLLGRHMYDHVPDHAEEPGSADADPTDDQQDHLNLGPTLRPHADTALSGRKVILGTSGSGKTNSMNVYCEELGKLDPAPAIILFDTDDENRALCNRAYLPHPAWLDKSRGLTAENAFETAQNILEQRYQCIINLQSYEDEEAAWIMINMIKGVRAWQEAREVRIPCEIVLDEASVWLPQNARESLLSSVLVDDPDASPDEDEDKGKKISLLALLQRAFFSTVVRRGRRRGMGFTLAAQRIAEIDKRALQGSWMFLMRQTQPADFREYQKFGISPDEALGLLDGEAFVFAPGMPRERHRLRMSNSPHGGVTPGMKALRGSIKGERVERGAATPAPEPRSLPTSATRKPAERRDPSLETTIDALLQLRGKVDEQTFLALLEALPVANAEDEEASPPYQPGAAPGTPGAFASKPQARQTQQNVAAQAHASRREVDKTQHFTKELGPELQAAYDAYRPGMHHHTLARYLGTTPSVAGQLLKQLQKRGLIDAAGNKTMVSPQENQVELQEYDRAVTIWHELEEKQRANVRDFAAAMKMGETKAWDLLSKMDRLGLIHWERRKKKEAI